MNLIALQHSWIGVPFLTYGTEQITTNGPSYIFDVQPLWQKQQPYSQTSEYYTLIQKINQMRDKIKIEQLNQIELEADDTFYAYARGNQMLVALTNVGDWSKQTNHYKVQNSTFEANARICDILNGECTNVNADRSVDVYLTGGYPRIFVREDMI
ncbi:Alpha_amylase [Hexamita inflata]|uniref:Alpha amylase n=1 Tax=Hexamita inflata TaxID=28002 RepID=A0AA86RTC3_9EUKA|nr:Alpha amylase [Hexamita inflata]